MHPCGCILVVHFFLIPRWYSTVWISTFYLPILLFMDTWVVSRLGLFWTKLPWTFYSLPHFKSYVLYVKIFMPPVLREIWQDYGGYDQHGSLPIPQQVPSPDSPTGCWSLSHCRGRALEKWVSRGALKHTFSVSQPLKDTVECCRPLLLYSSPPLSSPSQYKLTLISHRAFCSQEV